MTMTPEPLEHVGAASTRWLIAAVLIAVVGLAVIIGGVLLMLGDGSGHEALQGELDDLELPAGLTLIVDRLVGPTQCFAGGCPGVDRYYASAAPPNELCTDLADLGEDLSLDREATESGCRYSGGYKGRRLDIIVRDPQDEIAAYGSTVVPTPIEVPHQAIVLVAIS